MGENPYRNLPAVHDVLAAEALRAAAARHSHDRLVAAVRAELAELREHICEGLSVDGRCDVESTARRAAERLERDIRPRLRSVVNATGVVLHTNLGRAPTAEPAARAAYEAARGYLNLELDLETGKRSSRQSAVREWICRLTGAESATAVNNCAAATVIVLRAVAAGKEVIVSRGQLIEIGGGFRIPEIMAVGGAVLREVGTTNITRLADYERALGPSTAALMRVHTSNYRVSGFTKSVSMADLVALGQKYGVPVIDDVGSGALFDFGQLDLPGEPLPRDSIAAGADLTLFSGDKLLGGPQAGVIAGRKKWIDKIEKDPLMRAFRLDKMTLAALETTLRLYLNEEQAVREVPVLRLLAIPAEQLRRRAETLAEQLRATPNVTASVREDSAYVGGGSLPDRALPTWVVEIEAAGVSDAELARRLRMGDPPVMGRLQGGKLLLDVRTVFPEQEAALIQAIIDATRTAY
ncbi:MAG TPA: L-seryl-tRNA(Sec) selenium transferase [Gemmataceae bacterium]|nr:L-seryl-tRNA(Sec) selenium transferase [Gemmataceae bacterium]